MMDTIETFGYITKLETLNSIEHDTLPRSLVMESVEPFPGYYERNMPRDLTPRSIFLVLKEEHTFEEILRVCQLIKKDSQEKCNLTYAELEGKQSFYNAVRIIGLDCYMKLHFLQEKFAKYGIEFHKQKKVHSEFKIKVFKPFLIKDWGDNIYKDEENEQMAYLHLPFQISWKVFERITYAVKNNIENANFDAALAVMYRSSGIEDYIRIYDEKITPERAKSVFGFYLTEINKMESTEAMAKEV